MTTSDPIGHYLASIQCLAAGVFFLMSYLSLHAQQPPLPPGYRFPIEPVLSAPEPETPALCSVCGEADDPVPQLHDRHYAAQRISIDFYAPQWTGNLLSVEHGFQEHWDPARAYVLHPSGPHGEPGYAQLIMRNDLIVFRQQKNAQGVVTMACTSHPDWRLYRQGELLVAEQAFTKRLYFETLDFSTFRLKRLEPVQTPHFGVDLRYDGDHLTALVYPDGAAAAIEWKNEHVHRVVLPNGYVTILTPDANGFPQVIEVFATSDKPAEREIEDFIVERKDGKLRQKITWKAKDGSRQLVSIRRFLFENDSTGKILSTITPCGEEYTFEYSRCDIEGGGSYGYQSEDIHPPRPSTFFGTTTSASAGYLSVDQA